MGFMNSSGTTFMVIGLAYMYAKSVRFYAVLPWFMVGEDTVLLLCPGDGTDVTGWRLFDELCCLHVIPCDPLLNPPPPNLFLLLCQRHWIFIHSDTLVSQCSVPFPSLAGRTTPLVFIGTARKRHPRFSHHFHFCVLVRPTVPVLCVILYLTWIISG